MSFEIVTKFKFCKAIGWVPLLSNYACLCLAAANLLLRLLFGQIGEGFCSCSYNEKLLKGAASVSQVYSHS